MVSTLKSIENEFNLKLEVIKRANQITDEANRSACVLVIDEVVSNLDLYQRRVKTSFNSVQTSVKLFGEDSSHGERLFKAWEINKACLTYFQNRYRLALQFTYNKTA